MKTYAQRSIMHCLNMIAPFTASDKLSETSQLEFYQFMVSIYQGMYKDPEKYLVFPTPYEEYVEKIRVRKKEKQHKTDSKESTLRNTFQQAIQFYAMYFYYLGIGSSGIDGESKALVVPKETYLEVLSKMSRIHEANYNTQRFEVLARSGIEIYEIEDTVYIVHNTYNNAMLGLRYLCAAPDSKYKLMNFLRLDYINAFSPIPSVDDICKTLPAKSAEVVKLLEGNLSELKIKVKIKPLRGIVSDFKWKVEYSYKGKNICGFYADSEYFMLCIYFNHFQNITEFANLLYEEDYNLFQWFKVQFPERLCRCPCNRKVSFGEEARRICGLSNRAEIVNPTNDDVENAIYILRKYRNIKEY